MPDELTSIFISYARADSPFVDRLEADLHRHGFAPWLDRRGLAGGQQWRRELQVAVDRCQVLLVVLPETYDKTLFEHLSYTGETHPTANEQQPTKAPSERHNTQHEQVRRESSDELITMLLEDG